MEIVVLTYSSLFLLTFFIFSSSALSTNQISPSPSFSKAMDASKAEGKRRMKEVEKEEEEEEDEVAEDTGEDSKRRRALTLSERKVTTTTGPIQPSCQVEDCTADLTDAKPYHRRHKVCEYHSKAPLVLVAGIQQRFCQQCSRFHNLPEFDEAKRSCRRRLAGHNERRRKSSYDSHGDG